MSYDSDYDGALMLMHDADALMIMHMPVKQAECFPLWDLSCILKVIF